MSEYRVIQANGTNYTSGRQKSISRITIHHMAGVMSAEQCGRIFQTPNRGASAHYGIGVDGDVASYVPEDDTAWSDANWDSNCQTVSIETSNSSAGGDYPVSDASWQSLVKLVRDIATRHGLMPIKVGVSLFGHRDFAATACPGDYLYSRLQQLADEVNGGVTVEPQGGQDLNAVADAVIRGEYGNGEDRRRNLEADGYNYDDVQAIVNAKLGVSNGNDTAPSQDLNAVADAVLRGDYGNGDERVERLQAAGYNYDEVQALVNAKLGFVPQSAPQQAGPASIPIKEGDLVTPVKWVDYNGTPLVKTRAFYYVSELSGDRAVLRADGMSGPIYAAVKVNNLRKA